MLLKKIILHYSNEKVSMYCIFKSHIETNNKNKCIVLIRLLVFQILNILITFRILRVWFNNQECRI